MLALQTNSSSVNACMHGSLLAATGQQPGLSVQHKLSEMLRQWQIATACPLENGRIRILHQPPATLIQDAAPMANCNAAWPHQNGRSTPKPTPGALPAQLAAGAACKQVTHL
jgi:hypothetical protein